MTDSNAPKIFKTLKHRLRHMAIDADTRQRPGLKQQVEELGYLVEMLEKNIER